MLFSLNGPARSGNLRGIALAEMRIQAPSAEGTRPVRQRREIGANQPNGLKLRAYPVPGG